MRQQTTRAGRLWGVLALLAWSASALAGGAAGLVIADDHAYPPFAYLDANGEPRGITIDIWNLWSRRSGVPVRFRLMEWHQALAALRSGEVDAIGGMFHTRPREKDFEFTRQLQSIATSIFFDSRLVGIKDLRDLAGFRVGVVRGDSAEDLLGTACPMATPVPFADAKALVDAAVGGEIKVLVADAPVVHYYLGQTVGGERFRECAAPLALNRQCGAVRRGDEATLNLVNAGFERVTDEEIRGIMASWSGRAAQPPIPWREIGTGVAALVALLGGVLLWNVALRRRVTVATAVLHQRNAELEQSRDALLASDAELRESEARYRSVVENIEDVYYRTDEAGNLSMISPSGVRLLGYDSADQMLGRPSPTFWADPAKRQAFERHLRARGTAHDYEVDLVRADGQVVHVSTTTKLIVDDDGEFRGVEGIFRDIGARKAAEAALRESEERFRAVFEDAPYAIAIRRVSDRAVLDVNQAFADGIGRTRQEALDLLRGGLHIEFDEGRLAFDDIVDSGESVVNAHATVALPDGQVRHILFSTAPVTLAGEACVISMAVDVTAERQAVTEREKLREQLAQSQKMDSIGRLAGGVAHDFNNMLGVIVGHAELALRGLDADAPLHRDLAEILAAARRSADLTKQLLAFARRQAIHPQLLDVNETVAGMLRMLRRLIGENIELDFQPGAELGLVRIDPSQLDQLLANLCVNARDAIVDTGRVTIVTTRVSLDADEAARHTDAAAGEYVRLEVSDTGRGMDSATLSRVFEPFFTTKEVGQGTGLGLATVHGIACQNGGFVDVVSEVGRGTTFSIHLPWVAPEPRNGPAARSDDRALGGSETVLVVEDEHAVLVMATMMLERFGYTVLPAAGPEEALRIASDQAVPIALLLTDVVMPGMNGRDLADRLLAVRPGLRCLFMSGYTARLIAHHGVLDDGVPFIEKPFGMNALAAKVRAVLDGRE